MEKIRTKCDIDYEKYKEKSWHKRKPGKITNFRENQKPFYGILKQLEKET